MRNCDITICIFNSLFNHKINATVFVLWWCDIYLPPNWLIMDHRGNILKTRGADKNIGFLCTNRASFFLSNFNTIWFLRMLMANFLTSVLCGWWYLVRLRMYSKLLFIFLNIFESGCVMLFITFGAISRILCYKT